MTVFLILSIIKYKKDYSSLDAVELQRRKDFTSMTSFLLAVIYLSFISLGLPDALLGSAWPSIYRELNVPISYAGILSMIISAGTIFSSLCSDRLTRKLGTGKVTACSVGLTALALFGFSISHSFPLLCLWAVPYGLGAGSVDAALNNYVALHFASRHMSWLHCMWGVGASLGPYIMGWALTGGKGWPLGYRYISFLQIALTATLVFSLPLWKKQRSAIENNISDQKDNSSETDAPLSPGQVLRLPGAKETLITFFCYCALEQTAGLWGSSFLVFHSGITAEEAARFASLFFLGITTGRAISGFLTLCFNDTNMIRLGEGLILLGLFGILYPGGQSLAKAGLVLTGLGCAPIYPSIIHATPERFGAANSQAMIGVQMASAYLGPLLMPPLFGLIAEHISLALFPFYLLLLLICMIFMHEKLQSIITH